METTAQVRNGRVYLTQDSSLRLIEMLAGISPFRYVFLVMKIPPILTPHVDNRTDFCSLSCQQEPKLPSTLLIYVQHYAAFSS